MLLIDYNIIRENIKKIQKFIAVLKNNSYGFGLEKITKICLSEGINRFAVNEIAEAIIIRKINSSCEIILLGIPDYCAVTLKKYNLTPTALCMDDIKYFAKNDIDYYIKINSNMNRFGFESFNYKLINKNLKGIYSHFPIYNIETENYLKTLVNIKEKYNLSINVGGSILLGKTNLDLRVGGLLYENCRKMYARILQVKKLKKGQTLGYESKYISLKNQFYAILDVGYYNGIRRDFDGFVFYHNNKYKVIGLVCMNHMFIQADDNMKIGEYVEFFGDHILENEFLSSNNMSKYESYLMLK